MREIRFRLRDKENGILGYERWYVGQLHNEEEHTGWEWEAKPCWMYSPNGIHWHPQPLAFWRTPRFKDVWTGLRDKNGKDIYEGDVVHVRYGLDEGVYEATATIRWHDSSAAFIALNSTPVLPRVEPLHHEVEVLGNIYENRELIAR